MRRLRIRRFSLPNANKYLTIVVWWLLNKKTPPGAALVRLREAAMNVSRPQILEYGQHVRAAENDAIRERIALLLPHDRVVAELVLRDGATHRQIATLLKTTPGQVSRRVRRIANRLHDPRVTALLHPDCPLEPGYRQVGVQRFLQDKSVKDLAAEHACSASEIRRRIAAINFWYRALLAARRGEPAE